MDITPFFKWTLIAVFGITLLSFLGAAALAFANGSEDVPPLMNSFSTLCDFGFKSGLGALVGLITGKAA